MLNILVNKIFIPERGGHLGPVKSLLRRWGQILINRRKIENRLNFYDTFKIFNCGFCDMSILAGIINVEIGFVYRVIKLTT